MPKFSLLLAVIDGRGTIERRGTVAVVSSEAKVEKIVLTCTVGACLAPWEYSFVFAKRALIRTVSAEFFEKMCSHRGTHPECSACA
jgi:hypothetical protein